MLISEIRRRGSWGSAPNPEIFIDVIGYELQSQQRIRATYIALKSRHGHWRLRLYRGLD